MSKIINELIGKDVKIKTEEVILLSGTTELTCHVLDVDDEWIKVSHIDKKNVAHTQILKVEQLERIEILSDTTNL